MTAGAAVARALTPRLRRASAEVRACIPGRRSCGGRVSGFGDFKTRRKRKEEKRACSNTIAASMAASG